MTDLFNNTLVLVTTTSTSAIDYLQSNIKKDKTTNVKPEKQVIWLVFYTATTCFVFHCMSDHPLMHIMFSVGFALPFNSTDEFSDGFP